MLIKQISQYSFFIADFFPFGTRFNDTVGPRAVDATTDAIPLELPLVYYMKNQHKLFVSTTLLRIFFLIGHATSSALEDAIAALW